MRDSLFCGRVVADTRQAKTSFARVHRRRPLRSLLHSLLASSTVLTPVVFLPLDTAMADSGSWTGNSDSTYTNNANWTPGSYPGTGAFDDAGFLNSANPTVTVSAPLALSSWNFSTTSAASSYTINGAGQTVTLAGALVNTSSAGTHTVNANIAGGAFVLQNGAGSTLVLNGTNTYTGATTINAGTLRMDSLGALSATSALTIAAGGTLDLNSFSQSVASLSGAGTIKTNIGGNPAPTLEIGTDNSSTSFSGIFDGYNGTIQKQGTGTFTFSGTGPQFGNFNIYGGTIALTGAADITNSSVNMISSGTLDISGTNSGASIAYLIGAPGATVNLGSKTLTIEYVSQINTNFQGSIVGSGGLTLGLNSRLNLFGVNTYTGATTLSTASSYLALRNTGSIAASSGVDLAASGATLDISLTTSGASIQSLNGVAGSNVALGGQKLTITNASGDFAGTIGGTGRLEISGGHQTISGTSTSIGQIDVSGGTLSVNGSTAASSLIIVSAGGTLGGSGTVGTTWVNGGTLAPGNSIGTLTVNGNLAFTSAASYLVEVSPANADRVNVTGTATLGGATVNAGFAAGSYVNRQYTIVNATGGVSGTFNALVNTNLPTNFTSSLSYDANNAYLNLTLNFVPPATPDFGGGLSGNQANVGNALTNFFNTTGGIPLVFGTLTPPGLSQVSGETATGTQQATFDAMTQFMGVMTEPFIGGRADPVTPPSGASQFAETTAGRSSAREAYAMIARTGAPQVAIAQRWSVWAAGYGGSQTTDGNAALGSNTATSRIYGTAAGADYRLSPNTLGGFALAGGGTNFSVANGGHGRSDLFQAGAFIRHNAGPAYISAALAYGWQDITTDRTATIAGTDQLRARFNANAWSGRVEGGYRIATPLVGLTPYAAGQFTTFELPAYAEGVVSGANTFALAYGAKTVTATRSELGLRADQSFALTDSILTLRGRAAWAHDFNPDRNVNATFQTLPGASFVVNGAAQSADKVLTTASAEVKWLNGFSLAAAFEGEFAGNVNSYAGKGVARYAW